MIEFDITTYGKHIAMLFSGGSDSALMFYLAARQIKENNLDINIELYVTERYNYPVPYAHNVYNEICDRLDFHKFKLYEIERSILPKNAVIGPLIQWLIDSKKFDSVLSGKNRYPDDAPNIRPFLFSWFEEIDILKYPFKDYTKDILINEFYQNDISDILSKTHSCGWKSAGVCGECFNCRERAWAYSKLPYTLDMGI